MIKHVGILLLAIPLMACNEGSIEEFGFRKGLEYKLISLCGDEDKACISAVQAQMKGCMEKSAWRRFFDKQEDQAELKRFTTAFYACIVDPNGKPYFVSTLK